MKIISKRERVHVEKFMLCFDWRGKEQGGFSFECDREGNLCPLTNEAAQENYEGCISGRFDVVPQGIRDFSYDYTRPPVGLCEDCSRKVYLEHFTNTCECGADYNSSGTRLAPRSQWGEETGEHLSDILRIP